MNKTLTFLNVVIIFLSLITTICGVCSFYIGNSYDSINQYGENIKIWGSGIYAHDSYFKAPIFIGSDFTILIFIIPLVIISFINMRNHPTLENSIRNFSLISILLYYSASLSFGVTYNNLHLLYIALFGASFYCAGLLFIKLYTVCLKNKVVYRYYTPRYLKIYLFISGISLFIAWLPDIISSIVNGTSLKLIEVYTTEITYVLDMSIISPLIFLTLYLVNQNNFIGYILLRMILKICIAVGIMLPIQTIFQMTAGIYASIPELATKVLIFIMLGIFSAFFEHQLKSKNNCINNFLNNNTQ